MKGQMQTEPFSRLSINASLPTSRLRWLHEEKGTCGDGVSVIDNLATGSGMRAKVL